MCVNMDKFNAGSVVQVFETTKLSICAMMILWYLNDALLLPTLPFQNKKNSIDLTTFFYYFNLANCIMFNCSFELYLIQMTIVI